MVAVGFDPRWDEIHKSRIWGLVPNEHLTRFVRDKFKDIQKSLKALDVGCGAGAQTVWLANYGFDTIGIDGSSAAIQNAFENVSYRGEHWAALQFTKSDVCALPYDEAQFDLVTDVCCLQHVLDPHHVVALSGIARVLKPTGYFYSVTATPGHNKEIADTPMRAMSYAEIEPLYASVGLKVDEINHASYTFSARIRCVAHWLIAARKA